MDVGSVTRTSRVSRRTKPARVISARSSLCLFESHPSIANRFCGTTIGCGNSSATPAWASPAKLHGEDQVSPTLLFNSPLSAVTIVRCCRRIAFLTWKAGRRVDPR